MNTKLLVGVMVVGASLTVFALAASIPKTDPIELPVAEAPKPTPKLTPVVQAGPKQVATTLAAQVSQEQTQPQVIKVAAAAKPAPKPVQPAPEPIPASARQLDALLASVALYPDQLLSQILMAATYPLEVVEAARWIARPENEGLQGDRLADALDQQDWDPSVKALVAFPHILKMMDSDLDWMGRLGDAFLDQETEVMDSVQRLRREARDADKLRSDDRRRVQVQDEQIIIEPANPEVVYVPFYDPRDAYGIWPYPEYPPVYIPPPVGYAYVPGVYYSYVAIRPYWGWSQWDWRRRQIHIIDVPRYTYFNRGRPPINPGVWRHDPGRDGGRDRGRPGRGPDRDGRGNDGRGPDRRPPNAPPGGPVVQQPNPPPQDVPTYASRDPRRYRTPQASDSPAQNVAPRGERRAIDVPNIAPLAPIPQVPAGPTPNYANRDPRRYRTQQEPQAAPQPALAPTPQLPDVSTKLPAVGRPQQDFGQRRQPQGDEGQQRQRIPQQQPQQVFQAPPIAAPVQMPAPVAPPPPPPVINTPQPSEPAAQPNFRRGGDQQNSDGNSGAPCNPRRGECR